MKPNQIKSWSRHTFLGWLALGLVLLAISYIFAGMAIDSGAWWQWLIAGLALIYAVGSVVKSVRILVKSWIKSPTRPVISGDISQ